MILGASNSVILHTIEMIGFVSLLIFTRSHDLHSAALAKIATLLFYYQVR